MSSGSVDVDDTDGADDGAAAILGGGTDGGSCSFFCKVFRKSAKSRLFSFFSSSNCNNISCSIGSISGSSLTRAPSSVAGTGGSCSGPVSSEISIAVVAAGAGAGAVAVVVVGSCSSIVTSSTGGPAGAAEIVSSRVGCVDVS